MTSEKWKRFFRQKGWLDGNRFRQPDGVLLFARFRSDGNDLCEFAVTDLEIVSEDVIKVDLTPYGFQASSDKRYYLWDDLLYVRNYRSGSE